MAGSPSSQNGATCGVGRGDRFISIDPGVHSIKVLLGRRVSEGVRVLDRRRIPLREGGGSLSPEEARAALRSILDEWGSHPISICLPQRSALSQVVDLPEADGSEIHRLIEAEIGKLSGLNESLIAFDFTSIEPFGNYRNPFWVTFCQEDELRGQVTRLGLEMDDVCEITTSGNALLAAHHFDEARPDNMALIDLGAGDTSVVIVHRGKGVYAGAMPIGGDAFTDAISTGTGQSIEEAEESKIRRDLLNGEGALPTLSSAVDEWRREIERILQEWRQDQGIATGTFRVEVYSGAAQLPGFVERLNQGEGSVYSLGATTDGGGETDFSVAYGAGLMAAGLARQPASLIPAEARAAWSDAWALQRFQSLNVALLFIVVLFLTVGSWQQYTAVNARRSRLATQKAELEQVREARRLESDVVRRYNRLRPVLERQRSTLDTLETLSVLEATAGDRDVWYSLFADRESYVSMPEIPATNQTNLTNAAVATPSTVPLLPSVPTEPSSLAGSAEGFIAVATVPGQIEAVRETVARVVEELNRNSLFEHVDTLSSDQRRPLVDPAVVVPDRHYVFSLKLAANVFKEPLFEPGAVSAGAASEENAEPAPSPHRRRASTKEADPPRMP